MTRQQRASRILEKGQVQLLRLRSIDPLMDFGNDRNLTLLEQEIAELNADLIDYNDSITQLDTKKEKLDAREKNMNHLLDQLMLGVSGKYGNDSREYEMAGGTRKSNRVRKSTQSRVKNNLEKQATAANK
jgi:hypothetical protein